MARSVSLSDEAFAALRQEKREGESDSDVVLRLKTTAHKREKDPLAFCRNPPAAERTEQEYDAFRERMRQVDLDRGWRK